VLARVLAPVPVRDPLPAEARAVSDEHGKNGDGDDDGGSGTTKPFDGDHWPWDDEDES